MTIGSWDTSDLAHGQLLDPSVSYEVLVATTHLAATLYTDITGGTPLGTNIVIPTPSGQLTIYAAVGTYDLVPTAITANDFGPLLIEVTAPSLGGGGGTAGNVIVRKFPFAFDTPGILTGAALYTPTIGDVLLDLWVEIDTAWNGTSPTADVGMFVGENFGLWANSNSSGGVDMTSADSPLDGILFGSGPVAFTFGANDLELTQSVAAASANAIGAHASGAATRCVPAKFTAANPIKVCVSQDGTNTGADPGSTQGAAVLYLVTATPV